VPSTSAGSSEPSRRSRPSYEREGLPPGDRGLLRPRDDLGERRVEGPPPRGPAAAIRQRLALEHEGLAGERLDPLDVVGGRGGRDRIGHWHEFSHGTARQFDVEGPHTQMGERGSEGLEDGPSQAPDPRETTTIEADATTERARGAPTLARAPLQGPLVSLPDAPRPPADPVIDASPELRVDPLSGLKVILATGRADRAGSFESLPPRPRPRPIRRTIRSSRATRRAPHRSSPPTVAPARAAARHAGLEGPGRAEPVPGADRPR
jgi:hypothetical protein